ncbi:hypothetical protein DXG03_004708, partial [Asterophora parasitica]
MPRSPKELNSEPCSVCGAVIRFKQDIARHMKLHDKSAMMFTCPFDGCSYQNLQKSNVNTHMSKHTGEKPHACPDCEFRTADPGSLTRHRKRIHAYVPKGDGAKKPAASTKKSRRHIPYQRPTSKEISSSTLPEEFADLSAVLACGSTKGSAAPQDGLYSYPWDVQSSSTFANFEYPEIIDAGQQLNPALDTIQADYVDSFLLQYPDTQEFGPSSIVSPAEIFPTYALLDAPIYTPELSCTKYDFDVYDATFSSEALYASSSTDSEFFFSGSSSPSLSPCSSFSSLSPADYDDFSFLDSMFTEVIFPNPIIAPPPPSTGAASGHPPPTPQAAGVALATQYLIKRSYPAASYAGSDSERWIDDDIPEIVLRLTGVTSLTISMLVAGGLRKPTLHALVVSLAESGDYWIPVRHLWGGNVVFTLARHAIPPISTLSIVDITLAQSSAILEFIAAIGKHLVHLSLVGEKDVLDNICSHLNLQGRLDVITLPSGIVVTKLYEASRL